VGSVARVGGVTREVQVALDPIEARKRWVQRPPTFRASSSRCKPKAPVAVPTWVASEQPMRTLATVKTAEELSRLELTLCQRHSACASTKSPAVRDTMAEPSAASPLLNGEPVVGFEITRSKGASEVEVGAAVKRSAWPT